MPQHTIETIGKIAGVSLLGVTVSISEVEAALRIGSLLLGISLSLVVFLRNSRERKDRIKAENEKKNP